MTAEIEGAGEVRTLLGEMDAAFAGGDAVAFAGVFAEDGQLLLLHRDAMVGRQAIRAFFADFFARFDTSAWRTEHGLVETYGPHAHAFSTYTETLVPREGGPSRLVVGRLVFFLRHLPSPGWRIALLMNSHVRPVRVLS
jgi:uncharacterized protein (TIGR02246 family)